MHNVRGGRVTRVSPNDSPSFIVSFQDVGRARLPLRVDVRVPFALALPADVKLGVDGGTAAESDGGRMRGADNGGGRGALQGDMVSQPANPMDRMPIFHSRYLSNALRDIS